MKILQISLINILLMKAQTWPVKLTKAIKILTIYLVIFN